MSTSKSQFKLTKVTPAYWRVTFDNPPINILDPQGMLELQIDVFEKDPELKVVVLDSADPDFFVAHYDTLRAAETPTASGPTCYSTWIDVTLRLACVPVISVAAIGGRTRGVGSELVLACDLRFAGLEKAIFSQVEVGAGLLPGGGAIERLPLLTGRARALEITVGSADFDAASAERYDWINRAIPDAEFEAWADTFARLLASFDKQAMATAKDLLNRRTLHLISRTSSTHRRSSSQRSAGRASANAPRSCRPKVSASVAISRSILASASVARLNRLWVAGIAF
jgi:enoyl-CoA hydratase/carnithine racemase